MLDARLELECALNRAATAAHLAADYAEYVLKDSGVGRDKLPAALKDYRHFIVVPADFCALMHAVHEAADRAKEAVAAFELTQP